MKKPNQEYPLTWPESWPRSASLKNSQFKSTLPSALKNVQEELGRFAKDSGFEVEEIMISSNYSLGNQNPKDSGVAVYFTWDGSPTCIAVDRYTKIEDNLQAIFRCIEAERTKMRHGGLNLVRAAFRGYAALPPPSAHNRIKQAAWWETLGVAKNAEWGAVVKAFKEQAKEHHPDSPGGSSAKMAEINGAYEEAKKVKGL